MTSTRASLVFSHARHVIHHHKVGISPIGLVTSIRPCSISRASSSSSSKPAQLNRSSSHPSEPSKPKLTLSQAQRLVDALKTDRRRPSSSHPHLEQKWSTRTLITLATSVGAITYLIGSHQGYKAGSSKTIPDLTSSSSLSPPLSESSFSPSTSTTTTTVAASSLSLPLSTLFSWFSPIHCQETPPLPSPTPPPAKCYLTEMVQYHCELKPDRIICQPLDRIFQKCPGRPVVEVTHIIELDENGKPYVPSHLQNAMPPSQHWHELGSISER